MPSTSSYAGDDPSPARRPRGERLWSRAAEPLFLVSGQRRLIYANPAWEKLTGITLGDARGRTCRRRAPATAVELLEQVLSAISPPPDALEGRACRVRRRAPGKLQVWWEIDYFSWSGADALQGVLGKIRLIEDRGPAQAVMPEKLVQLRSSVCRAYGLESWTSDVPIMQRLVAQLRLAAQTRLPVLIQGPSGSGKEWAARTIHQLSEQRESFFAAFDARLPAAALAELFSSAKHWRLDAIYVKDLERLPRDAQALLVQRLSTETGELGPRLLAGTSSSLEAELASERILPELHARLTALTIQVPSLTQRQADLPRLLSDWLPRIAQAAERPLRSVSTAAQERLQLHSWPGNFDELFEVLVQASRRAQTDVLEADDLPFYLRGAAAPPLPSLALDDTLARVERRLIELAMRLAQANKTAAAELLAIWRPRLVRRLEQLGFEGKNDAAAD